MDHSLGDYSNEIDFIRDQVSSYFPIYKTEVDFDVVSIYIKAPKDSDLEERFDALRKEFVPQNYIPHLVEKHGEYMIKVKKQEEKTFRSIKVNIAMLFITIGTTLIAGAWWWSNYDPAGYGMLSLHNLTNGALYFTLPLLLILGTHEMGHYFMARYHNIKASLPFFLPMAPPLGTIGAFISIREPIPDKKSLLDVGIAGPVAGFLVAIPVTLIGLYLGDVMTPTATVPAEGIRQIWNYPVIIRGMTRLIPWTGGDVIHPTLFAGWVGFLVTGLNLLPASQLDGGHVVRSLFGAKAKYVSYAAFAFLIIVGIWQYIGWVVFAFLILFLGGVKHPPPLNDLTELDKKRFIVGGIAILILFISFHPIPVEQESFSYDFQVELEEDSHQELILGESFNYTLDVKNRARNVDIGDGIEYQVSYSVSDQDWDTTLWVEEDGSLRKIEGHATDLVLDSGEDRRYHLLVEPTENSSARTAITFSAETDVTGEVRRKEETMRAVLGNGYDVDILSEEIQFDGYTAGISRLDDGTARFDFSLFNRGRNDTFELTSEELLDDNRTIDFTTGEDMRENLTINLSYAERRDFSVYLTEQNQDETVSNFITTEIKVRSVMTGEERDIGLIAIRAD